ncbi:hypothetical protein MBLNU13_g04110t2 [Cladosporium sp. NU13]
MHHTLGLIALAAMAQAACPTKPLCEFSLTAYGASAKEASGVVGELFDGQNRIGQCNLPIPKAKYSLDSHGRIWDSRDRGCILTPPTTGFYVQGGDLAYNGTTTFWTCPTGDHGGWNIYSKPVEHQEKCVEVWLKVHAESGNCGDRGHGKPDSHKHCGCEQDHCQHDKPKEHEHHEEHEHPKHCDKPTCDHHKHCDKPKEPEHPKKCDEPKKCPGSLTKDFQFPHLILPIDSSKPHKAYTTSFNGTATHDISTIFNFDIPESWRGKRCSADFLFPEQSQLETSAFTLTGSGEVEFSDLYKPAVQGTTTFANKPMTHGNFPSIKLVPGNSYRVWEGPCMSQGATYAIEMKAKGDTCFNYFQDFNPCPIGLYVNIMTL